MTTPTFASATLELASELLGSEGFVVRRTDLVTADSESSVATEVLLAENPLFVLAAVVGDTLLQLMTTEPTVTGYLAEALSQANNVGDKAWDGYVVLMTSQTLADLEDGSDLHDLVYDTRFVRRIVKLGVHPDRDSVSLALKAFLTLKRVALTEIVTDVLVDLTDALASEGVPRDEAETAVEIYRRTKHG